MTAPLTPSEVLQLRMRAQLLSRPTAVPDRDQSSGSARVAEVARHMLALQGQDWLSSRWALGVRAPGTRVSDVYAAFNEGRIVRSWPMRSTVHVVAAEDIGWIQTLTSARVLRGAAKRREFLGIDNATLERVVQVSIAALTGGARLTRDELAQAWTAAGITWQSSWRYHLVWWLCQNGLAVLGPLERAGTGTGETGTNNSEPLLVLSKDWISSPRQLDGDEALRELAARYAAARGPITAKDFAWWSGLTAGESKRGLAFAEEAGALARIEVQGTSQPHWLAADQLGQPLNDDASWMLLPAFDEHLLGYTDRSPQLDAAHFNRIVPGRNGVFRATIVEAGRTRATWQRNKAHGNRLTATPFPGARIDAAALAGELERWTHFHNLDEASIEVG